MRERGPRLFESSRIFRYIDEMEKNDPRKMIRLSTACCVSFVASTDKYA